MKATRIAYSKDLNRVKYAQLEEQARRLGVVRTEVWQRFGSVNGVALRDRAIRDQWLAEGRDFGVLANAWKETLRDAVDDIAACRFAAKVLARRAINRRTEDQEQLQRYYTLLKYDTWADEAIHRRLMRL